MSYFKDTAGALYDLSPEDIANGGLGLIPADCVPITDEEAYIIQNPPPTPQQVLASQNSKLQGFMQVADVQKTALTKRIATLQDAIDNIGVEGAEEFAATPEEEAEFPVRKAQLTKWKNYSIALGRVTSHPGWPATVTWPVQPVAGIDLTVSAAIPETV